MLDRQRALEDFWYFGKDVWGLDLEECPHRLMTDAVQLTEDNHDQRFVMFVVPRGFYKTSIARAAAVWKVLRQIHLYDNLYYRVALCSATLALGRQSLRGIKGQLKGNRNLQQLFGELWVNDAKQKLFSATEDGIIIGPRVRAGEIASIVEPTFWVGSEGRISTGFHADMAYLDDLNNEDNVGTDHKRAQINDYYRLIYPILGSKDRTGKPTQILFSCTPWHDDDVRGMVRREEGEREATVPGYKTPWVFVWHNAYNEDGSAWWPTKYPLEELDKLRDEMTVRKFSANYLCDPIGDNYFVADDQIHFKSRAEFPPLKHFRATIDPNMHFAAKEVGCYAAIMVSGYDAFANLYFHDARGSREWDSARLIENIFQLNDDYPDIPILIEDVHMAHFAHAIHLEEANRGKRLRIQWVSTEGETKYKKWSKLQPRFRNHRVFFAEEIGFKLKMEIKDELVRGEAARFNDFLDAMAMAELGIFPKVQRDGTSAPVLNMADRRPADPKTVTFADILKTL